METYLGIDYGGTKLLIGEADEEGNQLSAMEFKTGKTSQREILQHLEYCLTEYKKNEMPDGRIKAAGIGIVGISDHKNGIWRSMNHEKGEDIPLAAIAEQILEIPVAIDNDVRSATTAELLWGCGKFSRDFVYINVGTGLAAGIVTDGKILRGANQNGGEIGHTLVRSSSSRKCVCGKTGCAELSASGSGIENHLRCLEITQNKDIAGAGKVKDIFLMAREGHEVCCKIEEEAEAVLAEVIENMVRTVDPDTVVLGGGVMQDEWFFRRVKARLHPVTMRGVTNGVRISSLHPSKAGVLGAAAVGKQFWERK